MFWTGIRFSWVGGTAPPKKGSALHQLQQLLDDEESRDGLKDSAQRPGCSSWEGRIASVHKTFEAH